ncbi:hypothetical protein [Tenuifilum osseticum]|uniref:hypothetical protein n=1 Tax=Tenuifilum osseticum TaxID=3374723 RepID=UPI0034E50230
MKKEKKIITPLKWEVLFLKGHDENITVKTLRVFGLPLFVATYKTPTEYGFISKA